MPLKPPPEGGGSNTVFDGFQLVCQHPYTVGMFAGKSAAALRSTTG